MPCYKLKNRNSKSIVKEEIKYQLSKVIKLFCSNMNLYISCNGTGRGFWQRYCTIYIVITKLRRTMSINKDSCGVTVGINGTKSRLARLDTVLLILFPNKNRFYFERYTPARLFIALSDLSICSVNFTWNTCHLIKDS